MAWRRKNPERDLNWAVSQEVIKARDSAGLTQREVWEALGLTDKTRNSYLRLEYSETLWSVEKLDAVARVLHTTASTLLAAAEVRVRNETGTDDPPNDQWIAALTGQ
ncbi:helix-turn-helix domain-containing protein [Nocardia farcinica]|uniref:Putative DNA-binding protein n=1 Tax=Nocardia farcinica (strain IFM 10152) TaxID=247156 RepID=Q5YSE3_NOCFA|nr:helix-turn-helix transcriptional regulator [Nocardia farcinica]BAD58898.1 putative DNA-binding protein [Nocardia farcinica IFM 10152]